MSNSKISIRPHCQEDIDCVVRMHQDLYHQEYQFNKELFGQYVDQYARLFQAQYNPLNERLWIAETQNGIVGSLALVNDRDNNDQAQLRWFLIAPEARGQKLGHRLIKDLLEFGRAAHYKRIFLWTVDFLPAARHLYGTYGFRLTVNKKSDLWGLTVMEERWDLFLE